MKDVSKRLDELEALCCWDQEATVSDIANKTEELLSIARGLLEENRRLREGIGQEIITHSDNANSLWQKTNVALAQYAGESANALRSLLGSNE